MTSWTVAHQVPLFMEFSKEEYWSELPCPSPGDLPDPGTELVSFVSPALQEDSLLLSHPGSPYECSCVLIKFVYKTWEFPGGPVVKTQCFHCHGPRFDSWSGN